MQLMLNEAALCKVISKFSFSYQDLYFAFSFVFWASSNLDFCCIMALFHFILLLCFLQVTTGESDNPGLFTADMSRIADDWLPVAGCRADCLNIFGKIFGVTVLDDCIRGEPCQSCWDGCACDHFKPSPIWQQCATADQCYAGCRWAKRYYEPDTPSQRSNSTSVWRTLFSVRLVGADKLRFNNTIVDENGRIYNGSRHLIFSISFKTGADRDWIQLYQPITTISDIYLRQNVPECLHGCSFRLVVYSAEEKIATATYGFEGAPRRVVTISRNATLQTDLDSSLTANLTWNTSTDVDRARLRNMIVVEWTRTVSDSVQPSMVNRSQNYTFVFSPVNDNQWYRMEDLLYNTRYEVNVIQNTTDDSFRNQYHFTTPGCRQTASEMRQCLDEPTATGQTRASNNSGLYTTLIAVGCVLFIGSSIAVTIMLCWRRSRAEAGKGDMEALRTSPVPNTYGSRPTSSASTGHDVRFLATTPLPVLSTTIVVSEDLETNPLITPAYLDIQQSSDSLRGSTHGKFVVTEGTYGQFLLAVKRSAIPRDLEAQERLRTEFNVLKHLRQCSQFARLVGSSVDGETGYGFVVLTRLEHSFTFPLRVLLQMYRKENILRKLPDGTCTLRLAGLRPNTAFLGDLSGRVLMGMAEKIAYGMAYLNSKKLVHGALCIDNIACDANFAIKIYGMSNVSDLNHASSSKYFNEAYSRWLPLEVLQYGVHSLSMKTDVWSFGVVMWEIATLGGVPYASGNVQYLIEVLNSGYRLEQSPICGNAVHEFILNCWKLSHDARPSMADIHEKLKCFTTLRSASFLFNFTMLGELEDLINIVQSRSHSSPHDDDELYLDEEVDDDVFADDQQEVVPHQSHQMSHRKLPTLPAVPKHLQVHKTQSAPGKYPLSSRLSRPNKLGTFVNTAMASMGSSTDNYETLE